MLAIVLMAQAMMATPTAEAEAAAITLARQGSIVTLLPVIGAKETAEMVAAHPELSPAEQATLRRIAATTLARGTERIVAAIGHEYAISLTLAEMRALIAFNATPAATHFRAVQPRVMTEAMRNAGAIDFKGDTIKAFCQQTGKACPKK